MGCGRVKRSAARQVIFVFLTIFKKVRIRIIGSLIIHTMKLNFSLTSRLILTQSVCKKTKQPTYDLLLTNSLRFRRAFFEPIKDHLGLFFPS